MAHLTLLLLLLPLAGFAVAAIVTWRALRPVDSKKGRAQLLAFIEIESTTTIFGLVIYVQALALEGAPDRGVDGLAAGYGVAALGTSLGRALLYHLRLPEVRADPRRFGRVVAAGVPFTLLAVFALVGAFTTLQCLEEAVWPFISSDCNAGFRGGPLGAFGVLAFCAGLLARAEPAPYPRWFRQWLLPSPPVAAVGLLILLSV